LFFTYAAASEIFTLSLHDALPIFSFLERAAVVESPFCKIIPPVITSARIHGIHGNGAHLSPWGTRDFGAPFRQWHAIFTVYVKLDRKSTRLNSSHVKISYAVFCLK